MDIKQIESLYGNIIKTIKELLKDENCRGIVANATNEEGETIKDKYEIRIIEKETIKFNETPDSWDEVVKYVSCPLDKETLNVILKLIESDEE